MDWYAWLCRAGLHPDVALDYALLFARNELGAADVRHLDHEFLLSMGVAVAKHRLDILRLARKESSSAAAAITVLPWRATRLLAAAVHRSARSALARLRASVSRRRDHRDRVAPPPSVLTTPQPRLMPLLLRHRHRGGGGGGGRRVAHSSSSWATKIAASPAAAAIRAGGKLPMLTARVGNPVLLTSSCADKWRGGNGAVRALPAPPGSIAAACLLIRDDDDDDDDVCSCGEDEAAAAAVMVDGGEEQMRWESMFQDLKPT